MDDSQYDLGTSTVRWQDVYADNLYGDGSNITNVGGGVPSGGIILWSGTVSTIPSGWYLCDGNNSTPDLRERFVVGAGGNNSTVSGNGYSVDDKGGFTDATLVEHSHTINTVSYTHLTLPTKRIV